ncbi:hypothetical protein Glove_493g38 [Diversispora epigaea]|uniref:Uncharacterized protein n=1 Tax=Diversispora epigaea TaxID=1348612 RepID=A0A397GMC0_9GLOM|nr:hypothetical protein Glove_493g38 [Diversispora epigaea]
MGEALYIPPDLIIETPSATEITDYEEPRVFKKVTNIFRILIRGNVFKKADDEIGDSCDTSSLYKV